MKFWKYSSFWNMTIKTLALLGTPGGIAIAQWQDDPMWLTITGLCAFLSAALGIWMVDKNNNGLVDIFEKKNK